MTSVNTSIARDNTIRVSQLKIANVARLIVNQKVNKAVEQLKFSNKRVSQSVLKVLNSAIANAENNHDLDIDELVVSEAYVGKNLVLKRGRPRARGRYGKILKPFSQLTIKVKQILANSEEKEKA